MKKFLILVLPIFAASCAKNIQSTISDMGTICPCEIIRGHTGDWNTISDDLARNIYRHNLMCEKISGGN